MTSRVQKGGPVFKPIAKSRIRATSTAPRQASTPAEGRGSVAPTGDVPAPIPSMPPPSMPPPATIPIRGSDPDVYRVADSSQPVASSSRTPPVVVPSGSRISAPPIVAASSQATINVVPQPRNPPAPPVIISRPAVPTIQPASMNPPDPSPTLVDLNNDGLLLNAFQLPPQDDFHFPENLSQFIAPTPSNQTTVAPADTVTTPENSAKKKLRKRKKKEMAEGDGDATEGESAEKPKKTKKKRATNEAGETSDGAQPKPKKKRKAKAENADEESTPKKKRKKSAPIFDPDADPGEEIDPTVITMAELCTDNGQGRISSKAIEIQKNHLAWKQQSKEKRARMRALAEQKKYGRPEEVDGETEAVEAPVAEAAPAPDDSAEVIVGPAEPSDAEPAIADASGSGFDYSQDLTRSRFTVQVRIGPNGETIIDEESLTVDRTEDVDTTNYVHVVESDQTKFVNSASYTKKCRGSRWSAEETDLFYEALAQHGENYELISLVLPGRSRTACKNKFKTEDKKDSARITRCLDSRVPIDMKTLGRITGRDFSGPVPIIKAPTPPPIPEPTADDKSEPETPLAVRKRSRSRALPSMEGVQIIGDADSYDA